MGDNITVSVTVAPISVTQAITESPINVSISVTDAPTEVSVTVDDDVISVSVAVTETPTAVTIQVTGELPEAPIDGKTYGRKDAAWAEVTGGGGTGPKGDKGDKGDQGIQGIQGTPGSKGDKGDTGSAGAKGDKGDKGDTGLTGAQGPQGTTGATGPTGATGATGAQGPQGNPGTTSWIGITDKPTIREILTAYQTYYVRTDGSDSNNGLANTSGGAFLTIQKAIDTAAGLDSAIYDVTIKPTGSFVEPMIVFKNMAGSGNIIIDGTSTSNCIIDGGFTKYTPGTIYTIKNLKLLKSSSWNTAAISCSLGAVILFQSLEFGAGFDTQISLGENGSVTAQGNYTISGGANYHIAGVSTGVFNAQSITITLTGTPAYIVFALAQDLGFIRVYNLTFVGSATGYRYYITNNAVIQTFAGGGNVFPGSIPGTTDGKGVYA